MIQKGSIQAWQDFQKVQIDDVLPCSPYEDFQLAQTISGTMVQTESPTPGYFGHFSAMKQPDCPSIEGGKQQQHCSADLRKADITIPILLIVLRRSTVPTRMGSVWIAV
jgi:hypothetical protein